jgi:proteasome lid subunit RPN8/RPN11
LDKDFEIEIQDENVEDAPRVQLPMNFRTFGEIENDDVKVFIKQDVYIALEKLAASDTSKELGSIILGTCCLRQGRTHVIISEYVEAKYTDASASRLTFTHETWDYIHNVHETRYPDQKIVGWQHTHPGFGVFLSNYDMFIHENFFNLPFQVAYVIDPIKNHRGFFQWKKGRVEKLKGYYIYDDKTNIEPLE